MPCMYSKFAGNEVFMISLLSILTNIIGMLLLSVCFAVSLNAKPSIFVLDIGKIATKKSTMINVGIANIAMNLILFFGPLYQVNP